MYVRSVVKLAAAGVLTIGLGTSLALASADDAIKGRQGCMKAHGKTVGELFSMFKGEKPYDQAAVTEALNTLDSAACFLHAGNKIYIPTPALQGTAPLSGTPTLAYAEPKLLLPLDNAKADGNTRLVTMTWASSVVLADNEYYVVHIQSAGAVGTAQFRTKLPTLILRPEMLENPASRSFVWWVSLQNVAGQEGTNKPGAFRELSPASEPRRFSW